MTDQTPSAVPTRRDDYLAGLDLERLRPDAMQAFFGSIPNRSEELLRRIEEAEGSTTEHPAAREQAAGTFEGIVAELERIEGILADAGLPSRDSGGAGTSDASSHAELGDVEASVTAVLGRLSTASSSDWTSGSPSLLDRMRSAVGEVGWLLHTGAERVDAMLMDGSDAAPTPTDPAGAGQDTPGRLR